MNNPKRARKEGEMSLGLKEEKPGISGNYSCDEGTSLIFNLCPEILTKIFKYLLLDDRKNGKLVCQQWYNFLTSTTFQREEKIVFHWMCSTEDVVSALVAYRCPLLYRLHFCGMNFADYPDDFWKDLGKDIRELIFTQCRPNDSFTVQMMEYCVNLTRWSTTMKLSRADSNHTGVDDDVKAVYLTHRVLDRLRESKIVRPNLISIRTRAEADESWLTKLFSIFPKISELGIYLPEEPNLGNFLRNLGRSNFLKKSLLVRDGDLVDELFHEIPSCTTLETLDIERMTDDIDSLHAANFLAFVSRQRMLKTFRIKFAKCKDIRVKSLATQLLHTLFDNCKNLRNLRIHHDTDFHKLPILMKLPLFEKLVASKLEFVGISNLEVDFSICPSLQNYNLRYVCEGLESDLLRPIFRGLKHNSIAVDLMDLDSLKSMVENQPNLVSLNICEKPIDRDPMINFEINEVFYYLSKLSHLRCLKLDLDVPEYQRVQINLPNLEYLDMTCYDVGTGLRNTIHCLPNLKYLRLNMRIHFIYLSMAYSVIRMITSLLKNLRFLGVHQLDEYDFNDGKAWNLFDFNPSLRIFYYVIPEHRGHRFVYDPSRKRMTHTRDDYHYHNEYNFNLSEMDLMGFDKTAIDDQ